MRAQAENPKAVNVSRNARITFSFLTLSPWGVTALRPMADPGQKLTSASRPILSTCGSIGGHWPATVCKRNCKRTTRHSTAPGITGQDHRSENGERERTVSYCTARANTRILELENRCTGNRTWVRIPPSPPVIHENQGFHGRNNAL
jgi:hypothetical protein